MCCPYCREQVSPHDQVAADGSVAVCARCQRPARFRAAEPGLVLEKLSPAVERRMRQTPMAGQVLAAVAESVALGQAFSRIKGELER